MTTFESWAAEAVASASLTRPGVMPPSPSRMWTRGACSRPKVSIAPSARPNPEAMPTPEAPVATDTNGVAGVGCPSSALASNCRNIGVDCVGLRRKPSRSSSRRRSLVCFGSSFASPMRASSSRSAHIAYSPIALCPAA